MKHVALWSALIGLGAASCGGEERVQDPSSPQAESVVIAPPNPARWAAQAADEACRIQVADLKNESNRFDVILDVAWAENAPSLVRGEVAVVLVFSLASISFDPELLNLGRQPDVMGFTTQGFWRSASRRAASGTTGASESVVMVKFSEQGSKESLVDLRKPGQYTFSTQVEAPFIDAYDPLARKDPLGIAGDSILTIAVLKGHDPERKYSERGTYVLLCKPVTRSVTVKK